MRSGRISCRITRTPRSATCQAASDPARPAPMIWMVSEEDLIPVMDAGLARFQAESIYRHDLDRRAQVGAGRMRPSERIMLIRKCSYTTTPASKRALSVSISGFPSLGQDQPL